MAVGTTAFPTSLDTAVELVEITNNASSTLSGNVLIGDVTIGVTDISEFPTTGYGTLTDDLTTPTKTEIISWTGISGSNLTGCTRGTQGTSAAAFSSGNYIEVRPTAGHHEALRGAVIAIETKLGTGSTIAVNKLAALTASRAVVTDASGYLASATVTAAEIGYLAGVTTPTGSGALVLATSPTLSGPSIAKLANLTSNGFVKTSGGDGTLSVDTSTYLTANQTITLSGDVTGSGTAAITATIANNAVTYAKIQNISATQRVLGRNTAGAGSAEEVTITQLLDWAGTAAQGDILYRGASSWALLPAGTNGHYLKTQGAAANPVWAAVSGGGLGDVVGPGSSTDNAVVRFDSTTGKLIQDSVVTIADTTGNMAGVGTLNTHTIPGGSADTFALLAASQSLTNKKLGSLTSNGFVKTSGGDGTLSVDTSTYLTANQTVTLSGDVTGSGSTAITTTIASSAVTYAKIQNISATSRILGRKTAGAGSAEECTLSDVLDFVGSAAQGDILYRGASGWTRLGAGTSGHYLQTQGAAANPQWAAAAGGGGITIGTTAITSGTAGRILYETSGNVVGEIAGSSVDANGAVQFAATARSSGVAQYFRINTPADTGQTASTESVGVYFGGNGSGATVTRTWANGAITTQRENVFVAPTYAFVSGSNTITTAATVAITGAPVAGSFATLTNAYALLVTGEIKANNSIVGFTSTSATNAGMSIRGSNAFPPGIQFDTSDLYIYTGGSRYYNISTSGLKIGSVAAGVFVSSGSDPYLTAADVGLVRAAVGIWRVSDASTGAGQLIVGSSSASTTAAQLYAISGSASRVALRVDSAATPSVDIVQFTNNGTNRWALNSSSTATTATVSDVNGGTQVRGTLTESITLSTSGTTTDSTIDLPANSIILSVTGRITTTITTATDWKLGDATIADRFSDANATLTSGTTTVGINQWKADRTTAGQGPFQQSTAKVRITTTGTPGAGVIRITIHYITLSAPTS